MDSPYFAIGIPACSLCSPFCSSFFAAQVAGGRDGEPAAVDGPMHLMAVEKVFFEADRQQHGPFRHGKIPRICSSKVSSRYAKTWAIQRLWRPVPDLTGAPLQDRLLAPQTFDFASGRFVLRCLPANLILILANFISGLSQICHDIHGTFHPRIFVHLQYLLFQCHALQPGLRPEALHLQRCSTTHRDWKRTWVRHGRCAGLCRHNRSQDIIKCGVKLCKPMKNCWFLWPLDVLGMPFY